MPETLTTLKHARDLIADPGRWTTGDLARNQAWEYVRPRSKLACQWCAEGAVVAAAPDYRTAMAAIDALRAEIGGQELYVFNDSHPHAEVVGLFEKAVARLEVGQ